MSTDHEKFVREQNEWCFLPKKEKVKFHSIILLEVFSLEDFQNLISGFDKLYKNLLRKTDLNYKDVLNESKNKLFSRHSVSLPYILHSKFKGKVLSDSVFFDLGKHIDHIAMRLYQIMPSFVVLQVQIGLNENVSDQINAVIYKYHKEVKEKIVDTKSRKYTRIYNPQHVKNREIQTIKDTIKSEVIEFLSNYFVGKFANLSKQDIEIIPSIDLYSISDFPIKDEKNLVKWIRENANFLRCLNMLVYPVFKYDNYIFSQNESYNKTFFNCSILANRSLADKSLYEKEDVAITQTLSHCSFDLLAILRWLQIQEKFVGNFNSIISKEMQSLKSLKMREILENRIDVHKSIFHFERFKIENKSYFSIGDKFNFVEIGKSQSILFENLTKLIKEKISEIEEIVSTFNKHSEYILNIKNVEYNKKIQTWLMGLTAVTILFMLLQIFTTPEQIQNYIHNLFLTVAYTLNGR